MTTKAKGSKKGPAEEKAGPAAPAKDTAKDAAGQVSKKKISQVKEMFPDTKLDDRVIADNIRERGTNGTVDLMMSGQLQNTAWTTVEKKALEKKKEDAKDEKAKGAGGRGTGRGAPSGGRGRGFDQARPAAMRPYSNPRPAQAADKPEGTGAGGVVKILAPVSVKTTTGNAGLSFADILKKNAAQAPPIPMQHQAPPAAVQHVQREELSKEWPVHKPSEAASAPAPAPVWSPPQGVWGQRKKEEAPPAAAKPVQPVQEPEEEAPAAAEESEVAEEEVEEPSPEETEEPAAVVEAEEEYAEEEAAEVDVEVDAEEAAEEEEEEDTQEAEEAEPEPAPAPAAPVLPAVQPVRQATAYRPPPAPVTQAERPEPAASAPKKAAPRSIPQFASDAPVVLPAELQAKASGAFTFGAPDEDDEDEEETPVVAAVEQVIAESTCQDVQTDPFMWEAVREPAVQTTSSGVQAMLPPVTQAAMPIATQTPAPAVETQTPVAAAPQPLPPVLPPALPTPTAPTAGGSPQLAPVQPPVVPAAAAMPTAPTAVPPAPTQQHTMPSSGEEAPYMGGMSGSDMYFGGGPPSPQQPQGYSGPPFPGSDQMAYDSFGAYPGYGRGKFPGGPVPPHAHHQPPPTASPTAGAGQDAKAQNRAAPAGPAAYPKPPAQQPAQQPQPHMHSQMGYGMPPYMPPYGMYGMYGMYPGMPQGMGAQGYEGDPAYSGGPGFDANKFNMAAAYYNPTYPPPSYNMPPYNNPMRPPWGPAYGPGMGQGMPGQEPQKYAPNTAGGQANMPKGAPAPAAANTQANKFPNPPRNRAGFGDRGGYQPPRYDQPQQQFPYYPPQGGYGSYGYPPHQQPHAHQQPGPQ